MSQLHSIAIRRLSKAGGRVMLLGRASVFVLGLLALPASAGLASANDRSGDPLLLTAGGSSTHAGADDPLGHDANDDNGVDPAGHDANDDNGVDPAGHDANDDNGGASGNAGTHNASGTSGSGGNSGNDGASSNGSNSGHDGGSTGGSGSGNSGGKH